MGKDFENAGRDPVNIHDNDVYEGLVVYRT
jgi:hypothetical protein